MKRIQRKQLGYSSIVYESDTHNGQYLDTKVIINDQLLCVIAGDSINEFHNALKETVEKYRI